MNNIELLFNLRLEKFYYDVIIVKIYMYCRNKRFAKLTDSETLKAVAADCISDSAAAGG